MAFEQTELVLGRGEAYFDRFVGDSGSGDGERYIGNTTTVQITREVEMLAVKRAYRGAVHESRGHVISESINVEFVTDNISTENWLDWFADPAVGVASYGHDYSVTVRTFNVKKGRYYTLSADAFGNFYFDRATFLVNDSLLLVAGVDYEFDVFRGRVYFHPASTRVSDGASVTARYYQRPSGTHVIAPNTGQALGSLRFLGLNQEGPPRDFFFPLVRLSPMGSIDLKGDEWQQMRFSVTALRAGANTPLLYMTFPGSAPVPITADTAFITADSSLYRADNGVWAFS